LVTHTDPTGPYAGFRADLHLREGRIEALLSPGARIVDADEVDVSGMWLLPGFTQTHTHLIQALFRGMADDLALMEWLRQRIWPLEAAHDADSAYWSARLGLTEMLLGGTTAILDMASVRHTHAIFEAADEIGIRAHIGKAMMDRANEAGLSEDTATSLETSCVLRDRWHNHGRLRYAFAPRFVPSCTEALLTQTIAAAREKQCLIHSHASENVDEVELVRSLTGMDNVAYLDSIGMTGPDVVLAHCIHLSETERSILVDTQTTIAHCPGSNFKLGSGIAPIPELLSTGARVTLGSDGAPCNNRMDMFAEMRLGSLMQKPRLSPDVLNAETFLDMATITGAAALKTGCGDLQVGSPADVIAVDPMQPHSWGGGTPAGALVYACTPTNVRHVWISGEAVVIDGSLLGWDLEETLRGCRTALERVVERAGL